MKSGIIKKILNDYWMGFLKLYSKKIRKNVKREVESVLNPGIVTVIHTFRRDLKWNLHVHMMVTEGGKGNITE